MDACVLGEHGKSQFVAWSLARIGAVPLESARPDSSTKIDKKGIAEGTRCKATAIMDSKGAMNHGIGGVAASLCKSVLFERRLFGL